MYTRKNWDPWRGWGLGWRGLIEILSLPDLRSFGSRPKVRERCNRQQQKSRNHSGMILPHSARPTERPRKTCPETRLNKSIAYLNMIDIYNSDYGKHRTCTGEKGRWADPATPRRTYHQQTNAEKRICNFPSRAARECKDSQSTDAQRDTRASRGTTDYPCQMSPIVCTFHPTTISSGHPLTLPSQ